MGPGVDTDKPFCCLKDSVKWNSKMQYWCLNCGGENYSKTILKKQKTQNHQMQEMI